MIVDPEAYRLRFFLERGFTRKECRSCGRYFWTLDPDRELCGDSPCVPYTFLGDPPTKRQYSIKEMREAFLSFFEKRGHARVNRYPVVARWRDDIFLTIASIADFQPHVTSGEVPPPFNPLAISQPCIRMNDLDNVGKTGGRHLSIFEMMAHHAFNSRENEVYWKEETVRYHHELLTEELGIRGEEISYIEHWWEGGGDAGPDIEGIVRGIEVSTLVFMQYKKVPDGYRDLPLRIVDTGYGLERLTWLSQGTPTAFGAVYGRLLDDFVKLAGISLPDRKTLAAMTKYAGMMNVVDAGSLRSVREHVAGLMGTDAASLARELEPLETLTAILDHTKALAFMLGDGIVPSNVKGGYLARLLVRRTKRLCDSIGMHVPLSELLSMQINHWKDQFPSLAERIGYVTAVADLEVSRYTKTLEQGKSLILRLIRDPKVSRGGSLPLENLIELYDSNGIPPEVAKEVCEQNGVRVEIPDTFDTIVAQRHSGCRESAAAAEADILEGMPPLPQTELVYYSDAKLGVLRARVLYAGEGRVVLDRTIFYPEGGGQLSDTGQLIALEGKGGAVKVTGVAKSRGIVVHFVNAAEGVRPRAGDEVECRVDWPRRMALARHHSSTHILLGAARTVLGEHVWQEGAQKSVERSRLDISHYEKVTPAQLREIETLANRAVMSFLPIRARFMDRNEAEQRFGFRLYQGGVVYGPTIRIVEIEGWDVEACGGIHCSNTGEIGLIKIIKSERIQDGVERLEFASGEAALRTVQSTESVVLNVAGIINTPVERIEKAAEKLVGDLSSQRKEIERLRKIVANEISPALIAGAEPLGKFKLASRVFERLEGGELLALASRSAELDPDLVVALASAADGSIVVVAGGSAVRNGANAGRLAGSITRSMGGRGGGRDDIGQGKVDPSNLTKFGEVISDLKRAMRAEGEKERGIEGERTR